MVHMHKGVPKSRRQGFRHKAGNISLVHYIKKIAHGADDARDLPKKAAYALFAAMKDGGVPEIELGAILATLRLKTESSGESLGSYRVLSERACAFHPLPDALKPRAFASDNGAHHEGEVFANPTQRRRMTEYVRRKLFAVCLTGRRRPCGTARMRESESGSVMQSDAWNN